MKFPIKHSELKVFLDEYLKTFIILQLLLYRIPHFFVAINFVILSISLKVREKFPSNVRLVKYLLIVLKG